MTEKIQASNFLATHHLNVLCENLDVEIAKVQDGDTAAIKPALFCLDEILGAQSVAAGVLRKYVLSLLLGPEDDEASPISSFLEKKEEEPPTGSWEHKALLIEEALIALDKHNEGNGWGGLNDAVSVLIEEIDIRTHLIPLLKSRNIKCGIEDIQGGFICVTIGDKKLTWSPKTNHTNLLKKWNQVLVAISKEWKDRVK